MNRSPAIPERIPQPLSHTPTMNMLDIIGIFLLASGGWLWHDSLNVREIAISAAKSICHSESLLLLDDTVAIRRLGLGRDDDGIVRIRRIYTFEYSYTGNERIAGSIALLGHQVLAINLDQAPSSGRPMPD